MKHKEVVCPHCQCIQDSDMLLEQDSDIFALAPEEKDACMRCGVCKKSFWVVGSYISQYETFKTEEEII